MKRTGQFFLFITLIIWGTVIGGIMYSHVAFLPSYLSHLPESTSLVTGPVAHPACAYLQRGSSPFK